MSVLCVVCCQPSLECIANGVRECIISKPVLNFCSSFEKIQLSLMWYVQLFASLPVFVRLDVSYFVLFIYSMPVLPAYWMKNFDVKYTAEALINFLFPLFETRKLKVLCYFLD